MKTKLEKLLIKREKIVKKIVKELNNKNTKYNDNIDKYIRLDNIIYDTNKHVRYLY